MRGTVRERLYAKLARCADPACDCAGCLLWTGCDDGQGYGQFYIDGKLRRIHRVIWELERGPIPPGLTIDHVKARGCRHKNCGDVAHLEPVTNRENLLRIRGTHTHCTRGHLYDEANTRMRPDRGRKCRACHREDTNRRRTRLRQRALSPG